MSTGDINLLHSRINGAESRLSALEGDITALKGPCGLASDEAISLTLAKIESEDKARIKELEAALEGAAAGPLPDPSPLALAFLQQRDKAQDALLGAGWTLAPGAAAWKPPLGDPSKTLEIIDLKDQLGVECAKKHEYKDQLAAMTAERDAHRDEWTASLGERDAGREMVAALTAERDDQDRRITQLEMTKSDLIARNNSLMDTLKAERKARQEWDAANPPVGDAQLFHAWNDGFDEGNGHGPMKSQNPFAASPSPPGPKEPVMVRRECPICAWRGLQSVHPCEAKTCPACQTPYPPAPPGEEAADELRRIIKALAANTEGEL